jgi:hypothetical protein
MGQIGCPETSVSSYQPTLHDVPGKRRPYILSHPCIDVNRHSLYSIWSYIQHTYPHLYLQALHKVYTHTHIHLSSFSGWRWGMLVHTTLTYTVTQNAGWSVLCRMTHTYHLRSVIVGSKWKSGWRLRLRWDDALPVNPFPTFRRNGNFIPKSLERLWILGDEGSDYPALLHHTLKDGVLNLKTRKRAIVTDDFQLFF